LQRWNPSPPKLQPKLVSELCTEYIEKEKQKFLATYETPYSDDANISIHPIFYESDAYKNATSHENSELEQYWKRRILFENTPRGNIIMHYDAYKLGFVYYSDISGLPYSLLNAVAMKYVRIYKCRDFFMDTHITPESSPSPFILRQKEKEENQEEPSPEKTTVPKSKAFAKLKQYNTVSSKVSENKADSPIASNSSKNISNIMISMGKISNFSFIPKEKKQAPISTKPLSYNDYKRQFNDFINNK
jgi:hypothetical protein